MHQSGVCFTMSTVWVGRSREQQRGPEPQNLESHSSEPQMISPKKVIPKEARITCVVSTWWEQGQENQKSWRAVNTAESYLKITQKQSENKRRRYPLSFAVKSDFPCNIFLYINNFTMLRIISYTYLWETYKCHLMLNWSWLVKTSILWLSSSSTNKVNEWINYFLMVKNER